MAVYIPPWRPSGRRRAAAEFLTQDSIESAEPETEADIEIDYLEQVIGKPFSPDSEGRHSGWHRPFLVRRRRSP